MYTAIAQLRVEKAKDTTGIMAEMVKSGGTQLHKHLLRLYNDITKPHAEPPMQWKQTTITIIHKSGDMALPQNYRPIAVIPLLYKLFARLLYNRLAPQLEQHQTPHQAGFRRNFSKQDHLYAIAILQEPTWLHTTRRL